MKIFHYILFLFFLSSSCELFAQNSTGSPYSLFGIGDIKPLGFGRNNALGGAGIALPSDISLNNINPASYQSIDSLAFKVETGVDVRMADYSSGAQSQFKSNVNFSYLVVGFRNTHWWANSIGFVPYSTVGNNMTTTQPVEGSTDSYSLNLEGTGGVNNFYWGNSFKLFPALTVGVNLNFLFGSISQTQTTTSSAFPGSLSVKDQVYLSKIYLNYGFQYKLALSSKVNATIGGIFGTPCRFNPDHEVTTTDNSGVVLDDQDRKMKAFTLPAFGGAGVALAFSDKLIVTSDYKFYNWANSEALQTNIKLVNTNNIAFGAEYTPSTSFRDPYLTHWKYRIGGFYNDYYMMISGKKLVDKGVSLGVGIPLMQRKMFINLAYQIGKKGSNVSQGIINETYQGIFFNISLFDFWFVKPKFD